MHQLQLVCSIICIQWVLNKALITSQLRIQYPTTCLHILAGGLALCRYQGYQQQGLSHTPGSGTLTSLDQTVYLAPSSWEAARR